MTIKQILTVGNPNSGKTTLFNRLTGSKQAIGNWAGVTVDKKTGQARLNEKDFNITDLPGIYSLDTLDCGIALDESIAVNALFSEPFEVLINVVDASTLERSLYLTLQLKELGRPMILVLNKMDVAKKQGFRIDIKALSDFFKCEVIPLTATSTDSIDAFRTQLANAIDNPIRPDFFSIDYGEHVEEAIDKIVVRLKGQKIAFPRAHAFRFLGQTPSWLPELDSKERSAIEKEISTLHQETDLDLMLANVRYTQVARVCHACKVQFVPFKTRITDAIDNLVLHPYLGLPCFFAVMYLMFMFSINLGSAFIDFFDILGGALFVDGVKYLLEGVLPVGLLTLVADGVGGGIQTVATFIPVILFLYLFMSLLESSGYMARAAFVLDKGMQKIGLPGKAFVPLVLGFGCNVPAIMATRTLERERERRLAAAMAPFMSCGARLPVYALFAAAFFPEEGQNLVFFLYLLGIGVAIFTGLVLRKTLFPGESETLLMEMPRYEWPRLRDVAVKTGHKLKRFVFGAGKTIVLMVTFLNFLNALGTDGTFGHQDSEQSVLSYVAKKITPVFAPIGIKEENWPATVGIITGIFAKEAVVGTLNSLYSPTSETDPSFDLSLRFKEAVHSISDHLLGLNLADPLGMDVGYLPDENAVAEEQGVNKDIFSNLRAHFTVSSAFAYLVFILLYTPCVAAMGVYVKEFGRAYAAFIAGWTFMLAAVFSTLSYQISNVFMDPLSAGLWMGAALLCLFLSVLGLHLFAKKELSYSLEGA